MSEEKPSEVYPAPALSVTSTPSMMPQFLQDPSIKGLSYDQLLNQRGVRMLHSRAIPCPNIITVDNNAHDPDCDFCSNDGFLYYDEREIWGTFGGNSIQKTFEAHGFWETGTATVTCPTEYPDGTEADFGAFDKLVIPDFTVRLTELKEYEPRPGMTQELRYPVENVDYASSIHNGVMKRYVQGVDFNINNDGLIVWVYGKTPAYDPVTGHGTPVSWAFYAKPVYIVIQTLRELRITQELQVNGQKIAKRLPQSILVRRDFLPGKPESLVNP